MLTFVLCGPDHTSRTKSYHHSCCGLPSALAFCTCIRQTPPLKDAFARLGTSEKKNGSVIPSPALPIGSLTRALKSITRKPSGARNTMPFVVVLTEFGESVPVATVILL